MKRLWDWQVNTIPTWEPNACAWYDEFYSTAPLLRRIAITVHQFTMAPRLMYRERLSWEEAGPDWWFLRHGGKVEG